MRWAAVSIYLWRSRYRGRALQVSFWPLSAVDGVEAGYTLNLTTWEKKTIWLNVSDKLVKRAGRYPSGL